MIWFDSDKVPHEAEIIDAIASISDEVWESVCVYPCGHVWDIINGEFQILQPKFVQEKRLIQCHELLAQSDYKAIKFAEGELSEYEYAPIRDQRRALREEIRLLELQLES